MINKLYPCIECETMVKIRSKGMCPSCRQKQRKAEGSLPVYKRKISVGKKRTKSIEGLGAFFEGQINKLNLDPFSQHSGRRINTPSSLNICHILPKRGGGGFPSVAKLEENVLFMTWEEHTLFDKLLNERDFLRLEKDLDKIWKIACERLPNVLSLATESNKLRTDLEEYLEI